MTLRRRSLIAGAALTHPPAEVQVYALDLGGGGLDEIGRLKDIVLAGAGIERNDASGYRGMPACT